MSYCNGEKKATVAYTSKAGISTKFFTNNVPIDVDCNDESRTGQFIFTLKDYGYAGNCQSSGILYTDDIIGDSYQVFSTTNPGPYVNCPWYEVNFFIGENKINSFLKSFRYSITQSPNPSYSVGGKFLKIKDASGRVIFKAEVKNCSQQITCGDECPEGFCKCSSPGYPGYCCLDCAATAANIRTITNDLRLKNG